MTTMYPIRVMHAIECGCCGMLHRASYIGDCREYEERFTHEQLDAIYGQNGWEIVTDTRSA